MSQELYSSLLEMSDNAKEILEDYDAISLWQKYSQQDKKTLVDNFRKQNAFIIHRLFEQVENVADIAFDHDDQQFYMENYLLDSDKRTWLHVAIKSNRNMGVIRYLVDVLHLKPTDADLYGYTAYHFVCQKEQYNEEEVRYFIKTKKDLLHKTYDDRTVLEFACADERKLDFIRKTENINIVSLLNVIDSLRSGLPEVPKEFNNSTQKELWEAIIKRNDKFRLCNWIKDDSYKTDKSKSFCYYVDPQWFHEILLICPETGLGILQFIRKKFLSEDGETDHHKKLKVSEISLTDINQKNAFESTHKSIHRTTTHFKRICEKKPISQTIFEKFTGIEAKEKKDHISFHSSSLFLSLVTGRLEVTQFLLTCCRFDIVPFAMLTCLMCGKFAQIESLSVDAKCKIGQLKSFCERYATEVISRTLDRDPTRNKKVVTSYLLKSLDILEGKNILNIAHKAKCREFLGLPTCQQAIKDLLYGKLTENTSEVQNNTKLGKLTRMIICPLVKYFLHMICHIVFLASFSVALIDVSARPDSFVIIYCILYTIGYLMEELRQIYLCALEESVIDYFLDETNILDMGGLLFMVLGAFGVLIFKPSDFSPTPSSIKSSYDEYYGIRLMFCVSLVLFYMRILYFTSIFERVGSKLKMIKKMIVGDLLPLILIFLVFITAFGVVFQSMISHASGNIDFYNSSSSLGPRFEIIGTILRRPAYSIFNGHYILDEMDKASPGNSFKLSFMYLILFTFLVVTNVMLFNLLIALFSYTVTMIIQKSKESWRARRYNMVMEYVERSLLPSPFSIICMPIEIICRYALNRKLKKGNARNRNRNSESMKQSPDSEANAGGLNLLETEKRSLFSNFSFYVLQAFALTDRRYQMISQEDDLKTKLMEEISNLRGVKENIEKLETEVKKLKQQLEENLNKKEESEKSLDMETDSIKRLENFINQKFSQVLSEIKALN